MKECCGAPESKSDDHAFRRVLWIVLAINAVMFLTEIIAGIAAGSVSLQADAIDFLGDAANYGISLFVVGKSIRLRSGASLIKGASMGLFGLWIILYTAYQAFYGEIPHAKVMGVVGFLALAANVACAVMLFRFREGDSNQTSVWICSRNDAISNIAVILAAGAVAITSSKWPDLAVASIMASLALSGAWQVIRKALDERRAAERR